MGIVYVSVLLVTVGVAAAPFTVNEPATKVAPAGIVSVNGKFVKAFSPTFVTVTVSDINLRRQPKLCLIFLKKRLNNLFQEFLHLLW